MKIQSFISAVPNKYLCKLDQNSSKGSQVKTHTKSYTDAHADAIDDADRIYTKNNMSPKWWWCGEGGGQVNIA